MKLQFKNPTIPYDLSKQGKVDDFQRYLAAIVPAAWVGFSMDFGNSILQIDIDSDNAALFSEFGEYTDVTNISQEELEQYLIEQMGG